ncbi:MAG: hypothetical protein HY927_08610 [Elusimicrobia bacterium]|nr:hypothetical protein [Elusimicrobiota bacterium]
MTSQDIGERPGVGQRGARPALDQAAVFAAALLAGSALALLLAFARAPSSADLLVPRRPFYFLFDPLVRAQQSPQGRLAVSWLGLLLLAGAAGLLLWRVGAAIFGGRGAVEAGVPAARGGGWARLARTAGCVVGLMLIGSMARASMAAILDVIQNAWFAPASVDVAEPAVAFLAAFVVVFAAARAALALIHAVSGERRTACACDDLASLGQASRAGGSGAPRRGREALKAAGWCGAVAACWLACGVAAVAHDSGKSLAEAAGIPAGPAGHRTVIVLTEADAPRYEVRDIQPGAAGVAEYSPESLAKLLGLGGRSSVHARSALRHAYTGCAELSDADGMRRAASKALEAGDPLAGLLLLGNLGHAPATPANLGMLDALADEGRWRVGAHAAAMLTFAYARFQKPDKAAYWLKRASEGNAAIPAGLLDLPKPVRPAKVRGRLAGGEGLDVALYARAQGLSAELAAMALAASTTAGAKGAFEFDGIGPGDYFLAVSFPGARPASGIRVSGHKGDIRVEGKDVAVPPLTILR